MSQVGGEGRRTRSASCTIQVFLHLFPRFLYLVLDTGFELFMEYMLAVFEFLRRRFRLRVSIQSSGEGLVHLRMQANKIGGWAKRENRGLTWRWSRKRLGCHRERAVEGWGMLHGPSCWLMKMLIAQVIARQE